MDTFDSLDDIQLALLLSLIANQHCILTTEPSHLNELTTSVEAFIESSFGLEVATVSFEPETSLDEFAGEVIREGGFVSRKSPSNLAHAVAGANITRTIDGTLPSPRLANVLLLKHLDRASAQCQAQVLELMIGKGIALMTRRMGIRSPKRFLIVAVLERSQGRVQLLPELIDHFFISHYYDSFPFDSGRSYSTYDSQDRPEEDGDNESLSSVVRKAPSISPSLDHGEVTFTEEYLDSLTLAAQRAFFHVEVKKYMMDIVSFLRLHRATARGVTPLATRHFELLVRCLAPLHNMTFVTPTLAQLAAPKVYAHRIEVCTPMEERSMMWGSNEVAVEAWLKGATSETVVDDVLDMVKAPV